ncbi:hypothetical protein [Nitrolancea hollandica]|uniref:Uncharacterized protein n=1 Tax=Nitrolancea hollandica Lb TaxID=1129897 RepID=I4EG18_9BACT|nr:hypothetical protein [Nitrolancea hollandica]CCF83630.1 hypothetical protein NITHO_2520005 [Nitrolancea hollandica Lb]
MSEPIEATISETIEGELLSVGTPARLLDVGYQNYVRADEIVGIWPHSLSSNELVRSQVMLRGGERLVGFVTAATLRKRWEAAMGVGE